MKHLVITYGDTELFNGEVAEFSWAETESEITVRGRTSARPSLSAALKQAAAAKRTNGNETVGASGDS